VRIDGVIERHREAMASKPELRHRAPASSDVIRRGVAVDGVSFGHGCDRTGCDSVVPYGEKSSG
jgi:hypothetical protein